MTDDRVGLADIPLTNEYLAMMLGTNRSGVTIAAATLRNAAGDLTGAGKPRPLRTTLLRSPGFAPYRAYGQWEKRDQAADLLVRDGHGVGGHLPMLEAVDRHRGGIFGLGHG
jgi:hypothetical protein